MYIVYDADIWILSIIYGLTVISFIDSDIWILSCVSGVLKMNDSEKNVK
jgi:hypothetical protein